MKKAAIICAAICGVILLIIGVIGTMESPVIASIGGADGPTAVFVAGKISREFWILGAVLGLVLLALAIAWFIRRKK